MMHISILLTDDHSTVRKMWSSLLNTDNRFSVIAEAATGEEAIEISARLRPCLAIMDINLPGISGSEAAQQVA